MHVLRHDVSFRCLLHDLPRYLHQEQLHVSVMLGNRDLPCVLVGSERVTSVINQGIIVMLNVDQCRHSSNFDALYA